MKMTLEIDTNMTDSEILAPIRKARKEAGEVAADLQLKKSAAPVATSVIPSVKKPKVEASQKPKAHVTPKK